MPDSSVVHQRIDAADMALSLCGAEGIEFGGQRYTPDSTKSYFQFQFSTAFPQGTTVYQTALHPSVIAKSYRTLFNQNINYEHQIAAYNDSKDVRDRVIGSVVAVEFPREPVGGWTVSLDSAKAPAISGIGVLYKQTQGMVNILGGHTSGRKKYTVSMEVFYPLEEAGFAVALNGKDPKLNFTPADMLKAGYEYVPYDKAPGELIATFSRKRNRVIAQWKGRKVVVLMGGLNNPVHYAGVGVVAYGAEPPAKIVRLAASANPLLEQLADTLISRFKSITLK